MKTAHGGPMWSTATPEIELLTRAVCVFAFVMLIMRLWGKKHLSELSPFDLVLRN